MTLSDLEIVRVVRRCDLHHAKAVEEVFCKMHEKGLIYKGSRIINWCPVCRTSISDAEVNYEEQAGHFWHIKYPVVGTEEFLEFATTRPETMLGDTAVAVHPEDERYAHLVGKTVKVPFVNREIPVIADAYVENGCARCRISGRSSAHFPSSPP